MISASKFSGFYLVHPGLIEESQAQETCADLPEGMTYMSCIQIHNSFLFAVDIPYNFVLVSDMPLGVQKTVFLRYFQYPAGPHKFVTILLSIFPTPYFTRS